MRYYLKIMSCDLHFFSFTWRKRASINAPLKHFGNKRSCNK
jgi:hypothetical protein